VQHSWTEEQSLAPSISPTELPTRIPTESPTKSPTSKPTTHFPTETPTEEPSANPTDTPTGFSSFPTEEPTEGPLYSIETPTVITDLAPNGETYEPTQRGFINIVKNMNITNPNYFCTTMQTKTYYINGNWYPSTSFSPVNITFVIPNVLQGITFPISTYFNPLYYKTIYPSAKRSINAEYQQNGIYVTFVQPTFSIVSASGLLTIWFSKSGVSNMFLCNNTCTISLIDTYFVNSLPIEVFIYANTTVVYYDSFSVAPYSPCPVPTTPFSAVWSQFWGCAGPMGQFLFVAAIIGTILILSLALFGLGLFLYYSCCCCCCKSDSLKITNKVNNFFGKSTKANEETIELENTSTTPKSQMSNWLKSFNKIDVITVLLFLPLICGCSAQLFPIPLIPPLPPVPGIYQCGNTNSPQVVIKPCQYSFSISSEVLVCTGGTSGNCTISFNEQITIPLVGQTVCLNLMDSFGAVVQVVQLTYVSSTILVTFDYQYLTSGYTFAGMSSKGCASGTACPLSGCPPAYTVEWQAYLRMAFSSWFSGPQLGAFYGQCVPSCGCISCGCFFCNDGCLWTGITITPTDEVFYVYSPLGYYEYPVLTGMMYSPNNVILDDSPSGGQGCYDSLIDVDFTEPTFEGPTQVYPSGSTEGAYSPIQLQFTLISQVNFYTPLFGANMFWCTGNLTGSSSSYGSTECYYGPGNPATGIPTGGIPGDLQTQYIEGLRDYTFLFPYTDVQVSYQQASATFLFPPTGASKIIQYPSVTETGSIFINGFTWYLGQYEIYTTNLGAGPITFGVSTPLLYTISYSTSVVCPIFTIVSTSGCAACLLGATIIIDASSTCSAGVVSVSGVGPFVLGTTSLSLGTTTEEVTICFNPENTAASGTITLTAGTQSYTQPFSGYYPLMSNLGNGTWTTVQGNGSLVLTTLDFSDWWNGLSGDWTWAKWVLGAIIGVIVLLFVIFIIVFFAYAIGYIKKGFTGYTNVDLT